MSTQITIQGLGCVQQKYEIPIYATPGTIAGIQAYSRLGAMPEGLYHVIHSDESFMLGDIRVIRLQFPMMPTNRPDTVWSAETNLWQWRQDLGIYDAYTVSHLQNLDAVLLEANHDLQYVGSGTISISAEAKSNGRQRTFVE